MSPASQGALEVERYIGSCLISSTGRPALQKQFAGCRKQEQQAVLRTSKALRPFDQCQFGTVGTWAGGAPLISMASNPRRNNQRSSPAQQNQLNEQHLHNRVPLSRLAVHTQGAPLILAGRFPNNRPKIHNSPANNAIANCVSGLINGCSGNSNNISNNLMNNGARCHPPPRLNKSLDQKKIQQQSTNSKSSDTTSNGKDATSATGGVSVANIDSLSIASDESSGSNNSENSLPRIIKPRKRRKKDRKPPVVNVVNSVSTAAPSTNDIKASDEVQQTPLVVNNTPSSQGLFPNGPSEQHQQQQPQQHKPYIANSYDGTRYSGDNYYKGHRRSMNNSRENGFNRQQPPSNNCLISNSSNNNTNSNSLPVNNIVSNPQQEIIDTRQQQQQQPQRAGYAHRHVQLKVLDDNRNVILPLPVCQGKNNYMRHGHTGSTNAGAHFLHECNEPVTLTCHQDAPGGNIDECCLQGSPCQCRYCDSATLIWDVSDQNGYSHQFLAQPPSADFNGLHRHHHHHHHRYSQVPTTVFLTTTRPFICQEHANAIEFFDVADNSCLRLKTERPDGTTILRRSWSDPTSYFSDDIIPNRDVGVIGDRGQSSDALKSRSSWRGDASAASSNSPTSQPSSPSNSENGLGSPGIPGPLEVSTEIITSPNGHRDLEIKFYSSSPTTYSTTSDEFKNAFAFPDDDNTNESEEISDIWSYHESKLQQDFRTLLQAEE